MLPNRIVAATFVGLFLVQTLAGAATAQGQLPQISGPDIFVEHVDAGTPRIVGIPTKINITVRNQGNADFNPPTGWQIFVGFEQRTKCIEPGDGNPAGDAVPFTSPCFIRMTPTQGEAADGTNATRIRAGERRMYALSWNASTEQRADAATIYVEIGNLGAAPGGATDANCQGPDAPHCQNNLYVHTGVVVGQLGVRAVPIRERPPHSSTANENVAWQPADITETCPEPPASIQRGCKVRAGRTVVATYSVKNVGTVDDSYTPSLLIEESYLRRGYVVSFAPHNFTLAKAQEREVRLTIFVPENETAGNTLNVQFANATARWTSTRSPSVSTDTLTNPGCNDPALKDFCVNPTLPSLVVDVRRGFNATVTSENRTYDDIVPGGTLRFFLLVNNTGNAPDTFNVSFDNASRSINDSWTPVVTPVTGSTLRNYSVKDGEVGNYTVQVTAPRNATNGTYYFDVTIRSYGDEAGDSRCKALEVTAAGLCRVRFVVHLKQAWQISGAGDVPARVVPGETITYNLAIRNSGNGHDNLSLELQTTVFGWDVRLSDRIVRLTPFNTTSFTLTVTSPPNVPENTIGGFYVNATANGPLETPFELRSKVSIESLMTIMRGPNLRLEAPVNSSFVDAGSIAVYDVVVTNVGNVADNFTIPTPQRPSDWGVTVQPDFLELQPNQQGTTRITLRAPNGASVGEKATAIVKIVSTVDPSREKSLNLEGRVSGPDFFVDSVLINSSAPYTGDVLEASVVVGNNGNKASEHNVTLKLFFVQGGVEREIGRKVYPPLSIPGQRRLVETFTWDTGNFEGSGVLLARIDSDVTVPEIDDSPDSNEKTRAVTLRTFDLKITPATGLSARPGEKLDYSEPPHVFIVEYRGNQPTEPVTIRFESEHGWLSSQSELSLALPRGTAIPVIAKLEIPELPGTATDQLSVTVIPALRPNEPRRATTTTTIVDEENPRIPRISIAPATATLGDPVTIEVHVEDATGVSSVTAYVQSPTNESQGIPLTKSSETRWNATRTFTVAGIHRVTAEASDAASPPNQNRSRTTVGTFTIAPGSAPTIKLASGQPTTIRTGSSILLNITDPLGVGKASYSIRGVSYEMRAPGFQIDTSTFAAGPVDIVVTAENIYGVATSQKFSFTVDNAPPGITRVVLAPERPRANEDVTLTITTEPKVQAVDVLVKRDGQVVQTLNATRKGAGTFEVKFNPGEGDYRLDVTARDAAGNTKLAESAVVFSARPGSPVPAAGPVLAALAIAAVALLAARRRAPPSGPQP